MAAGALQGGRHVVLDGGERLANKTSGTGDTWHDVPLQSFDLPQTAEKSVAHQRVPLLHQEWISSTVVLFRGNLPLRMIDQTFQARMPEQKVPDEQ